MIRVSSLLAGACLLASPALAECNKSTASYETAQQVEHSEVSLNIVETAAEAGSFGTLLAAAEAAGLVDALSGDGPLTVFAPTDDAFAALPEGTVETLLQPENKDQLAGILKLHVIAGAAVTSDQLAGKTITADSLNGKLAIDGTDGVTVNGSTVVAADVEASNGVIHVIDAVILEAAAAPAPSGS
ncbi:MAG: fasciclin domain-containing protein [Pseudomonadota bacterium]